jgi:hypothetical protein
MSLCQVSQHRTVNLSKGLASSGPARVGTLCRQSRTNSSQESPLPLGNGMFRAQVSLTEFTLRMTSKTDPTVQPSSMSAHQEASFMKRILSIALFFMATAGFAAAQITTPTTDVLGAHLKYGRGCAACHAPHSGAYGNGAAATADAGAGNIALWGEDVSSLYGHTIVTGKSEHGSYSETLPGSLTAGTADVAGVLMCLSCHDGNLASGAMMKNKVYEDLPATYGTRNNIPTLMGSDGGGSANYLNDHPVGTNAIMSCGGQYDWDCNISATGKVLMNGPKSTQFIVNYGFFVSPGVINNQPVVMCTTCHNQHLMNVVNVKNGVVITGSGPTGTVAGNSGLPAGTYATMFFLRGPYNPASGTAGSNQTAQFCRQCHGGEANEMAGSSATTTF